MNIRRALLLGLIIVSAGWITGCSIHTSSAKANDIGVTLPSQTSTEVFPTFTPASTSTPAAAVTPDAPNPTPTQISFTSGISAAEASFLANHEITQGDKHKNILMITYDDGGAPRDIESLMDAADLYQGKITFFVTGVWLTKHPDAAKEIVQRGDLVECHGWDHTLMSTMDEADFRKQIVDFLTAANQILPGYQVKYIRFPYGSRTQKDRDIAAEYGLQSVMWNAEIRPDEKSLADLESRIKWGTVLLAHSTRPLDVNWAYNFFKTLHEKGYEFLTLDDGRNSADVWNGN
jgi:peptidoglycan-N-acetylmuramic acid deacetylase